MGLDWGSILASEEGGFEAALDIAADERAALAARLKALKEETAEWIDELQGEDARQAARLDALERDRKAFAVRINKVEANFEMCEKGIDALEDGNLGLELRMLNQGMQLSDRLHALAQRAEALEADISVLNSRLNLTRVERNMMTRRVGKLEKWVDGTDLVTSERFCTMTERVAALEKPPDRPAWERDVLV